MADGMTGEMESELGVPRADARSITPWEELTVLRKLSPLKKKVKYCNSRIHVAARSVNFNWSLSHGKLLDMTVI